jgi:hypothetical protein
MKSDSPKAASLESMLPTEAPLKNVVPNTADEAVQTECSITMPMNK